MDLPAEIRMRIYHEAIKEEHTYVILSGVPRVRWPNHSRTSRKIRRECKSVFYANATIRAGIFEPRRFQENNHSVSRWFRDLDEDTARATTRLEIEVDPLNGGPPSVVVSIDIRAHNMLELVERGVERDLPKEDTEVNETAYHFDQWELVVRRYIRYRFSQLCARLRKNSVGRSVFTAQALQELVRFLDEVTFTEPAHLALESQQVVLSGPEFRAQRKAEESRQLALDAASAATARQGWIGDDALDCLSAMFG